MVDGRNSFYVLNPSGDLENTQKRITDFVGKFNWPGLVGQIPSREQIRSALTKSELFLLVFVEYYFYLLVILVMEVVGVIGDLQFVKLIVMQFQFLWDVPVLKFMMKVQGLMAALRFMSI